MIYFNSKRFIWTTFRLKVEEELKEVHDKEVNEKLQRVLNNI